MKKWIIFGIIAILTTIWIIGWGREEKEPISTVSKNDAITLNWMIYGERYKEADTVFEEFNKNLQEFLPGVFVLF